MHCRLREDSCEFATIEYTPELEAVEACGVPGKVTTDSWKGKKVVLVGIPGGALCLFAFTPTCTANHIPPYLEKIDQLKAKGVDQVYVIASNDVFVMSAFVRALKTADKIGGLADSNLTWLEKAGLVQDLSAVGFGKRASRFALVIDDLKVTYVGVEEGRGVEVSGVDAVLAKL
ncbi:peroxiredoxin type-2 [Microbotryomycetes sp. JL201]|nr:peroxiredoxin type-2 [Microbotryomycetes sp. JL201]